MLDELHSKPPISEPWCLCQQACLAHSSVQGKTEGIAGKGDHYHAGRAAQQMLQRSHGWQVYICLINSLMVIAGACQLERMQLGRLLSQGSD